MNVVNRLRCAMRYMLCLLLGLGLGFPAFPQQPELDEPAPVAFGKVRLTLDPGDHVSMITRVLFTADGARLITAGVEHTIRIWDHSTGELLRTLRPPGMSERLY